MRQSNNIPHTATLQHVLDEYSASNDNVGLQATIVFADGSTWTGVSGHADRKRACPLTPAHHLYIGSMTKLYTAVLVMKQVEKGTLALDYTLDTWIDLSYGDTVTVEMLLNRTSGVPSYTEDVWFLARYFLLAEKQ